MKTKTRLVLNVENLTDEQFKELYLTLMLIQKCISTTWPNVIAYVV